MIFQAKGEIFSKTQRLGEAWRVWKLEEVENDFSAAAWFSGASCHHVVHWAATCYLWLSGIRNMGSVTEELNF